MTTDHSDDSQNYIIMRISHLIQTIQPDLQILTGVHEGDSFSKKKATTKKTPEQSQFHFPMTGAAMVQLASSDKMKNALRTILKVNLD